MHVFRVSVASNFRVCRQLRLAAEYGEEKPRVWYLDGEYFRLRPASDGETVEGEKGTTFLRLSLKNQDGIQLK